MLKIRKIQFILSPHLSLKSKTNMINIILNNMTNKKNNKGIMANVLVKLATITNNLIISLTLNYEYKINIKLGTLLFISIISSVIIRTSFVNDHSFNSDNII